MQIGPKCRRPRAPERPAPERHSRCFPIFVSKLSACSRCWSKLARPRPPATQDVASRCPPAGHRIGGVEWVERAPGAQGPQGVLALNLVHVLEWRPLPRRTTRADCFYVRPQTCAGKSPGTPRIQEAGRHRFGVHRTMHTTRVVRGSSETLPELARAFQCFPRALQDLAGASEGLARAFEEFPKPSQGCLRAFPGLPGVFQGFAGTVP